MAISESKPRNPLDYASTTSPLPGSSRLARFAIACGIVPFVIGITFVAMAKLVNDTSTAQLINAKTFDAVMTLLLLMLGTYLMCSLASVVAGLVAFVRYTHQKDR